MLPLASCNEHTIELLRTGEQLDDLGSLIEGANVKGGQQITQFKYLNLDFGWEDAQQQAVEIIEQPEEIVEVAVPVVHRNPISIVVPSEREESSEEAPLVQSPVVVKPQNQTVIKIHLHDDENSSLSNVSSVSHGHYSH